MLFIQVRDYPSYRSTCMQIATNDDERERKEPKYFYIKVWQSTKVMHGMSTQSEYIYIYINRTVVLVAIHV